MGEDGVGEEGSKARKVTECQRTASRWSQHNFPTATTCREAEFLARGRDWSNAAPEGKFIITYNLSTDPHEPGAKRYRSNLPQNARIHQYSLMWLGASFPGGAVNQFL